MTIVDSRLENEIDRLNREIDELKQRKKEDEEEIINEWKQKVSKKQREYEDAIDELQTNHRYLSHYLSSPLIQLMNLVGTSEALGFLLFGCNSY